MFLGVVKIRPKSRNEDLRLKLKELKIWRRHPKQYRESQTLEEWPWPLWPARPLVAFPRRYSDIRPWSVNALEMGASLPQLNSQPHPIRIAGLATSYCAFLSVSFLLKNHCFAWRVNQWTLLGGYHSSPFIASGLIHLGFGPLKGFLRWHSVLNWCTSLPELQRNE